MIELRDKDKGRLERLLDFLPDSIVATDADGRIFLQTNRRHSCSATPKPNWRIRPSNLSCRENTKTPIKTMAKTTLPSAHTVHGDRPRTHRAQEGGHGIPGRNPLEPGGTKDRTWSWRR